MTLVRRKDPGAFEVVYDRHGAAAYSLAHRIVGDAQAAEDVTQEAFLSVWRSDAGYDPGRGSVRGWLFGIVRNRAIDSLRHEGARPARSLREPDDILGAEQAPERTDAEALRRDAAHRVRGGLGELPPEQSRVIELAYFGGFTHAEIAQLLGVPLGTVKGRMRLGLEKMRAQVAEGML